MLTVRNVQRDIIWLAQIRPFEDELFAYAQRHFLFHCSFIGEDQTRVAIRYAIGRAQERGLTTLSAISFYLGLAFMLGSDFEEDSQYAWIAALLHQPGTPKERARGMFDAAVNYLNRIDGEDNREYRRSLIRLFRYDSSVLDSLRPDALTAALPEVLGALRPSKAHTHGPDGLRVIVAAAGSRAKELGFRTVGGTATHTIMVWYLGEGYHRDPFHPWATEAVNQIPDSEDRAVENLRSAGQRFLRAALSQEE
jgi:hypothetical protein